MSDKCENCLSKNVCRWYENGTGKNLCCADDFPCTEQKDKDRFVEVPFKVGDYVYLPWEYAETDGIAFLEVMFIVFDCQKPYIKTDFDTDDEGFWDMCNGGVFYFEDFGKTVFLTKEEAEQALKERNG